MVSFTLRSFTFALNNVTMRRGVVTGSVLQGMALTVPIGGLSFLVMTIGFGELGQFLMFPMASLTWLASQGIVHFVIGRYCNYKSNQLMGVNLTAPVVQLQVPSSPEFFRQVRVGEHGTVVVWTDEIDMAADKLWRLAQEQAGETMTPDAFRHWRERKALKTLSILYQSYRSTSLGQGNSGALNLYYSRHDDM